MCSASKSWGKRPAAASATSATSADVATPCPEQKTTEAKHEERWWCWRSLGQATGLSVIFPARNLHLARGFSSHVWWNQRVLGGSLGKLYWLVAWNIVFFPMFLGGMMIQSDECFWNGMKPPTSLVYQLKIKGTWPQNDPKIGDIWQCVLV